MRLQLGTNLVGGETKVVRKFAWFPTIVNKELIWFEYYWVGYQAKYTVGLFVDNYCWKIRKKSLKFLVWDKNNDHFKEDESAGNTAEKKDLLGVKND